MDIHDLPLSFNQLTARDLPLATAAEAARASGFQGFSVLPSAIADLGVSQVRSILDGEGLEPASVCAFLGLLGSDHAARAERLAVADRCLAAAAELGVPLVVVVGGPGPSLPLPEARRQAATAVDALLDRADSIGASVLIEPLHPALIHQSVTTSVPEALALVGERPNTGIVVDTWHVWWADQLDGSLADAGRRTGIVHLSDWAAPENGLDRALPGDGIANLPTMCAQLLAAGFTGWWEVEVLSERLWAGDQRELVSATHRAATEVLDKARALLDGEEARR